MIGKAALVSSAILASLGAPPVAAQPNEMTVTGRPVQDDSFVVRVAYSDLNLANEGQARTLWRRVSGATSDACKENFAKDSKWIAGACSVNLMAQARPQIAEAIDRVRSGQTLASAVLTLHFRG
jgi:UrcA family protein